MTKQTLEYRFIYSPQVHRNGILSFQDTGNFDYPQHLDSLDDAVIAPFWHGVRDQRFGNIYYKLSTNHNDFTKLQQILTTAFPLEDFEITQTFVATYDRLLLSFGDRVSYGML